MIELPLTCIGLTFFITRFPLRPGRQRICFNCQPGNEMEPASSITQNGKQKRKANRLAKWKRNANVEKNDRANKWNRVVRNNLPDHNANTNNKNTLWDRDVSAGRVILYKGEGNHLFFYIRQSINATII